MKTVLSLVAVAALAAPALADCHSVSVSVGYQRQVALVASPAHCQNVSAVLDPADEYVDPAPACHTVSLLAPTYTVGLVDYHRQVFARRVFVRGHDRVVVVRDRNVRVDRRDGTGVVGIARAAVGTVKNVVRAVVGR